MTPLSKEDRLKVVDNQIREWRIVGENAEVAIRVHRKIGSDKTFIDTLANEMIRSEKAIDELGKIRTEIESAAD